MLSGLTLLTLACTLALAAPMGLFCLEVLLSLWPRRGEERTASGAVRTAVVIPAHDEQAVLGQTLATLSPTLGRHDRILVVADNCSDNTAQLARDCGAQAIERENRLQRGKGYALDYGLQQLAFDPPDVVVFLDADCQVQPNTVGVLAQAAHEAQRPVQGLNLCDPDADAGPLQAISGLAFRFKNLVRTTGLIRLGGNCYLTGTGMALPWSLVSTAKLASGNVVEDMQLAIDLALAGTPPLYVPEARVDSPLPKPAAAARTQRTRWEHGHLSTILHQCPRLFVLALRAMRWDLLLLSLDLAVPPLSLLMLTWTVVAGLALLSGVITSQWQPAALAAAEGLGLALAVLAGWWVHCRKQVRFRLLATAPLYALHKLPIYLAFLKRRQQSWVRTQRPSTTVTGETKQASL
jgi:cellulose synthase/poly-beta-1,6-N-acetylglucosamine synthase-like glycosyltransferase